MPKVIDMFGKKIGRLLVVGREENSKRGQARWRCICECGNESIVVGNDLRNGNTRSCSCLRNDLTRERSTIHGYNCRGKTSKIYFLWKNARHRGETKADFPEFLKQQTNFEPVQK